MLTGMVYIVIRGPPSSLSMPWMWRSHFNPLVSPLTKIYNIPRPLESGEMSCDITVCDVVEGSNTSVG